MSNSTPSAGVLPIATAMRSGIMGGEAIPPIRFALLQRPEQNYRREQSYNLALAIWSLVEQNAASLRAEEASDATVSVVQRDAVARILAEVCYATDGNEDELISEFSEKYSHIRANRSCRSGIVVNHQRQISWRTAMSLSCRSIPLEIAAETRPTETRLEGRRK